MPVEYAKFEVTLQGMEAESAEKVKKEIWEALRLIPSASMEFETDIQVELIESAGSAK